MEMDLEILEMETGIQSIQNIEMCGRRSMVKLGDFGEVSVLCQRNPTSSVIEVVEYTLP